MHERLTIRCLKRFALAPMLALPVGCPAADADEELRQVAMHHKGGETAAAMKWYRFAAERGNRVSLYQLGLMYLNGEGVPADKEAAPALAEASSGQAETWRQ